MSYKCRDALKMCIAAFLRLRQHKNICWLTNGHQKAHNKDNNKLKINLLVFCGVNPWGVEPQSKEPESFILSIELRVRVR